MEHEAGRFAEDGEGGTEKDFDFFFGDFNNLLDISRKDLQPILFDFNNFFQKKKILFEKDQMKTVFSKCKGLKNFSEAEISAFLSI